MNAIPTREELFAMAASPIGDKAALDAGKMCAAEKAAAAKRAQKVWLPLGKRSPVSREAKEAEKLIRANQIDLEDAVVAAGGERGRCGS